MPVGKRLPTQLVTNPDGTMSFQDKDGDALLTIDGASGLLSFAAGVGLTGLKGYIPIDIFSNRLLSTNAFLNTIEAGTADGNTGPSLARVNGATDKLARLVLAANTTDEFQLANVALPPDLDDTADLEIHLLVGKGTNTDTTATLDVQVFIGIGDTECGGATAALNFTAITDVFATVAAADIPAASVPMGISIVPGTHANDAIHIYGGYVEYTRKVAA